MADLGTAYIRIAPNMSGIQGKITSGLRGSGTPAGEQLGSEIGNGASAKMAALSGVIAGATAAIVNKGIEVASGAIKDFISSASEIQSLRASFESLTGSVDATNKVMNTLYQFGKQTAFSNQDIQAAGRSFLAVGQNADQMQESLKLAGDIAGATGADLSQLVLPLSQAYARGTLQTQDFYQILNSGAGALRGTLQTVVQAKTGISNLGDAMSQGKVTTDLLWEAMRMADQEGGFAFNGAIKQSETFNGRMSNLKEAITNAGLSMLGVNAATGEVDKNGAFAKFSNTVSNLTNTLSSADFQAKMQSLASGVQSALSTVANVIGFIVRNKDIFLPIAVAIGTIVAALKVWAVVTKGLALAQAALNIVLAANPIGIIILAIAGLVAGLAFFFTKTETGKKVWSAFTGFLVSAWNKVVGVFSAIGGFFAKVFGGVQSVLQSVGNFFTGIFNAIGSAVSAFLSFFQEHWRIIIVIVLGPLGLLIDFVTAYWSQITGAISTAVNWIAGIISTVFQGIANFFGAIWSGIVGIITGYVNLVWSIISTIFNAIAGFLTAVFGPPIAAIIGAFQRAAAFIGGVVGGIWNGITSAFNSVVGFLGGIGSKVIGIFAGAGGWLVDAGKNIINGLINGAGSLLKNIGSMFLNMIPGWIVGPFKKALGIHSPSRVFAGLGDNITQGLINGIVDNAKGVASAVQGITDAAMYPLTTGINPSVAVSGSITNAGPGTQISQNTTYIDTVVASTPEAVKEVFNQMNQDTINVGMGLTPNQGAA